MFSRYRDVYHVDMGRVVFLLLCVHEVHGILKYR